MNKYFLNTAIILFLFGMISMNAGQQKDSLPAQSVKGIVINTTNQLPVTGASIYVVDSKLGAISQNDGTFKIKKVPAGRYEIKVTALGMETYNTNIVVTSGKEVYLNIQMAESFITTKEVVVRAEENFKSINESAIVSSTQFTMDDVNRFAGSRSDPARMVQNFAGVLGIDGQRNDIIIRGGAPTELLWRIDGLDVPNPNHFATQGATGGPVSAINSLLLDNSDFMTGAFPAEYQDKLSGVFDLRTRSGNKDKYEYTGQFGFNGFEFGAEGPAIGANSSFIANYRYSFLGILEKMGVDFGFSGVPYYQDATFKYDLKPSANDKISFTGLWGTSSIGLRESKKPDVYTGDFNIDNGTDLVAFVANWTHVFSPSVYGKLLAGFTYSKFNTVLDSITTDQNSKILGIDLWADRHNVEGAYNIKYSLCMNLLDNQTFTIGTEVKSRFYNMQEQRYQLNWGETELYKLFKSGTVLQSNTFLNWNWRFSEKLTSNLGLGSEYLDISKKLTIEPRINLNYKVADNQYVYIGYGIHRQSLPLLLYFTSPNNKNLDFMQSIHYIAGYSNQINEELMMKVEGYYKDLSKIPVEVKSSAWSFLNEGAGYGSVQTDIEAVTGGTGKTYGAEFTLSKHFSSHYYFTTTASLIRQFYKGSDGVERTGAFDNKFIFNVLGGYEYVISPTLTIEFSGKFTAAGGSTRSPIDIAKSIERNNTYYIDSELYSLRNPNYSKFDFRIDFRQNFKGWSLISFFSVENLLNQKNVLIYQFDKINKVEKPVYQLGMFPIGGLKIEF